MVDVGALSDAEIRTKLIEFGFPIMPITGTTRKVMLKKLKLLMDNKGKTGPSDRRSLAQFSSEEESDTDVKVVKKDKNRRATMAVPPMQPPPSSKVSLRKATTRRNDSENEILEAKSIREERKSRTSRILEAAADRDIDTNSDSEPDIVETDYKLSSQNHFEARDSPVKTTVSSSYYSSTTKGYSPPKQVDSASSRYTSFSPSRFSTYNSPTEAADKLNQIRSRLSLGTSGLSSYESPYATLPEPNIEGGDAPFLSNFTKRLSQLSTTKVGGDYDAKTDVIKEHDSNGSSIYTRSYLANRPKPREYSRDYQTGQDRASKGNNVSILLVGSVALFFLILAVVYWGLHSGTNGTDLIDLKVPLCDVRDFAMKKGRNCIVEDDKQGAVDLYTVIKPQLIKQSLAHKCTDSAIKPYMTEQDIVSFIKNNYGIKDEFVIKEDLNNFLILLYNNPLWEISVLQATTEDFTDDNKINSLDTVFGNKDSDFITALAMLSPAMPVSCTIYNSFVYVLKGLLLALASCAIWWLSKYSYKYYKFYEQRRKDEIILMVEKIIDVLQSNVSDENESFLVINHVRDMILPINSRKKMEQTWLKAVRFINENESRVRTEVQVVHGEQYEVWRWVGGLNTSSARNKSWQGQAFETQIGSVNSPPCSPTPCLKIRGMVDDGDRNLHTIREAVLVKCAEQCRILHCAVDVNSKCVYLKCADQNEAAVAYRNLHGWWYASHLVTVKYLRLERYMQRFPDSPQSGPPFLKAHQSV